MFERCARERLGHTWPTPHTAAAPKRAPIPAQLAVKTSDHVQLAVHDYRVGAPSHTVVFLHGLCLSSDVWAASIDELVGHSMGGMAALSYLARPGAHRPVEPTGLVLAGAAAGKLCTRGLGRLLGTPATDALAALGEHTTAFNALGTLGRWCARQCAAHAPLAALTAAALDSTPVSTVAGFLPALASFDQYAALGSITARTWVISGGADPLTPPAHARDLAGAIPGARHRHLPHAGHMLPTQAPDVISEAINHVIAAPPAHNICRPPVGAAVV